MISQRIALVLRNVNKANNWNALKRWNTTSQSSSPPSTNITSKPTSSVNANVPGLSNNCLNVPNSAVGPGASTEGDYKVPEYFCYDKNSYFEAEIEILKYRCPQPSSKS